MKNLRDLLIDVMRKQGYNADLDLVDAMVVAIEKDSEIVERREKAKAYDSILAISKDEWLNSIPEVRTWKEKAESNDKILNILSAIGWNPLDYLLNLKEKAEKWDNQCPQCKEQLIHANIGDGTVDIYCEECGYPDENRPTEEKAQLDRLMDGLMVKEECHNKFRTRTIDNLLETCEICHDTGYITRPATVEEVAELLKDLFEGVIWNKWQICDEGGHYALRNLKLDYLLFMEEKK